MRIKKSPTADTRSCDCTKVSETELFKSSMLHIGDVRQALGWFGEQLSTSGMRHDFDKVSEEGGSCFHKCFAGGFSDRSWLENHYKVSRHHLNQETGVPDDVDLIDVLEHVADCVMAGMARSGDVFPIELSSELLQKAVANTVRKLQAEIKVVDSGVSSKPLPPGRRGREP